MDQILLFGDSITQQSCTTLISSLSSAYVRRLDVVNRGFSGYNTRLALRILPSVIPSPRHTHIRILTVFLGANDARLPGSPGGPEQHVPLEEYRENLRKILTHGAVKAHEGCRVVLVTPPPVDERMQRKAGREKYGVEGDLNRTAEVTARYARAAREVGEEVGVEVLDLWRAMIERAGGTVVEEGQEEVGEEGSGRKLWPGDSDAEASPVLQGWLHDGLHFTPDAYRVLYEELMGLIARKWPDQMPEKLKFVHPAWDSEVWEEER